MDIMFPPSACVSGSSWDLVTNSAASRSIFTGAVRTVGRQGSRWRVRFNTANASSRDNQYNTRAALQSLRAKLDGMANRVWLYDPSYRPRGSFPATELLSNNTFANGTTGWTVTSGGTLTVADRVARLTATSYVADLNLYQEVALAQYVPYVIRTHLVDGQASSGLNAGPAVGSTGFQASEYLTTRGLRSRSVVSMGTTPTNQFPLVILTPTSGSFISTAYTSLSRCALVDNGPNLLLQSDDITNAAWSKTRSSAIGSDTAPDGTATGRRLVEDSTASETHYVEQSATVASAATDFCAVRFVKAGTRTWVALQLEEGTSSGTSIAYLNLSTGALGSVAAGTNWSNARASVAAVGNGWYRLSLVARKTNAATTVTARTLIATGNGTVSYSGDGASYIGLWRGGLAGSSVAFNPAQTTSTATTGTAPTGSALYIKGLPASTNGLLLEGDRFQIGTQLCKVTAALNSDAAGLGYLQFAPALRASPADNAPVIIHQPMMRAVMTEPDGGWSDRPGVFSDFDFQFEEALDV